MAETSGLVKIEDMVDRFIFRYKVQEDDWDLYLEHACAFLSEIRQHHGGGYEEDKVAVDSLGFIDMPTDLLDIVDIYLPKDGEVWYFTRNDGLVTTTTLVNGSETFDDDYGEGTNIRDARIDGYGALGGVNDYYYTPIWDDRQILVKGVTSANVTLRYKTTGLDLSGITYVPANAEDVVISKLKMERAYIDDAPQWKQVLCRQDFKESLAMYRKTAMMSANEFKDIWRSVTTQAPMRYE